VKDWLRNNEIPSEKKKPYYTILMMDYLFLSLSLWNNNENRRTKLRIFCDNINDCRIIEKNERRLHLLYEMTEK